MSNVKKVAQNTIVFTIGTFLNRVFEFIGFWLLTRYIDREGIGNYTSIFAYLSLFGIFADLGINIILRRECAKKNESSDELLKAGFALSALASVVVVVAAYFLIQLTGYPDEVKSLFWYASAGLIVSSRISSFRFLFNVTFVVRFKLVFHVLYSMLDRILFLFCLIFFISQSRLVTDAVFYLVLCESVACVLFIAAYARKFGIPRFSIDFQKWKFLLRESWPLLFTNLSHILISRVSIIIMTSLLIADEVGIYGIAAKIPVMLSFIPQALVVPVFQVMSHKYTVNREAHFDVYSKLIKYLLFLAFPIVMLIYIEIDEVIIMLFPNYLPSIAIAKILIIGEIFSFAYQGFSSGLISKNSQRANFYVIIFSALTATVLSMVLIPVFQLKGAAYAAVFSSGLFLFVALFISKIRKFSTAIISGMVKPGIAALLTGVILFYLNTNMWISILLGPVIYLAAYVAFKGPDRQDFLFLNEIFPNRFAGMILDKFYKI